MEIANLEGSGLFVDESCIFGFGTGIYVWTRETLDCFCTEYSGSGAPSAWTDTAIPLNAGMVKCMLQQPQLRKCERLSVGRGCSGYAVERWASNAGLCVSWLSNLEEAMSTR
jgi:hypothetical protein